MTTNQQILENTLLKTSNISLLVTGNVPFASGLSSSSSLTVCSAIVFLEIFGLGKILSKQDLAELTIKYERSVGTACGGMDQTICLFGEKIKAKVIDFNPIKLTTIDLPKNVSFIIGNSLTPSAKIDTLAFRYNKRVVENKLGIALIANKLKLTGNYDNLLSLQKELQVSFSQMKEIISTYLNQEKYTLDEVKKDLEINDLDLLLNSVPFYKDVLAKNTHYLLKQRLMHVASEAERVLNFSFLCNPDNSTEEVKALGDLMNASHYSCKNDYECSSEHLDKFVDFMTQKGAYGCRLTGAGWGGCFITMVDSEKVNFFMESLEKFYRENYDLRSYQSLDEVFFITKPGQGACIFKIK